MDRPTSGTGPPRPERLPATRIGPVSFAWGSRTFVMGILNVTPDSFSGDGLLVATDPVAAAVAQARAMVADGADILDIGGESTRPGHSPVTLEEERDRVIPVIAAVRAALPATPLSIDTTKVEVAAAGIDAGGDLVNDVWGVGPGDGLARLAAERHVPMVVMHNAVEPPSDEADVITVVLDGLPAAVGRAEALGVDRSRLIVDPGIGFGKTAAQNLEILRRLGQIRDLGLPVLLGTSRKSTIGRVLDLPANERLEGTLATTALGVAAGVDIVRVHDVRANARTSRMSDAIIRGWTPPSDPANG